MQLDNGLSHKTHSVRVDNVITFTLVINTGVPQGCVLRRLLYTLFTHECSASSPSNLFVDLGSPHKPAGCSA